VVDLLTESSGGTNALRARSGAVALALADKDPGAGTFDCDSIRKDLRTMVAEAQERGFRLPLTEQALAVYDGASAQGWGQRDCAELPRYWSRSGKLGSK
jgi:3-hydroxyisobutyrate dehydrogenase